MERKPPRWFVAPLYARGYFSPRLLMAWQAFYFSCWLAGHYVLKPATVVNLGTKAAPVFQMVPAVNPFELVGLIIGLVGLLLGLGTFQKVRLDGPPPAPEVDNSTNTLTAQKASVSAQNLTMQTGKAPAGEDPHDLPD